MLRRLLTALAVPVLLTTAGLGQASASTPVTLLAAGDIACPAGSPVTPTSCQQAATGALAASLAPRYVVPLGDLAYPYASYANLKSGYDPAWGQVRSITKPVPGNHELIERVGYNQYWGAKAHEPQGYYSFSTGSWHVLVLNTSSCSETTGSCGDFTGQAAWITADLAAHPTRCAVAFVHHPLWSYGKSATPAVRPLYAALSAGGVDLVVTGHDHNYQRFAAQLGLTEFVVGTGGVNQIPVGASAPNRVAAFVDFGVLDLSLAAGHWSSAFRSISGAVRDPASGVCH